MCHVRFLCLIHNIHIYLLPIPHYKHSFAYEAGRDDPTNSPPGLPPREYCSHWYVVCIIIII